MSTEPTPGRTALVITPEGGQIAVIGAGLEALQELVGGWIEAISAPAPAGQSWTAYVNEEGKLLGLPGNDPALRLLQRLGWPAPPREWIAGTMVVVGYDPDTGCALDLPEHVRRAWCALRLAAVDAAARP